VVSAVLLTYGVGLGVRGGTGLELEPWSAAIVDAARAGFGLNPARTLFLEGRDFFFAATFFFGAPPFFFDAALRFFAIISQLVGLRLSFHGYGQFPPDPQRQLSEDVSLGFQQRALMSVRRAVKRSGVSNHGPRQRTAFAILIRLHTLFTVSAQAFR
jgi:hypothetical protein